LRHVGIPTQNIEEEKATYEEHGLKCIYDEVEKVRIVKLQDGNGSIVELLQYETQSENMLRQRGIAHVAFTEMPGHYYIERVMPIKDRTDR